MKKILFGLAYGLASIVTYAGEVNVLSAAAVKTSVTEVPALYKSLSGDYVHFEFGTAGGMHDALLQGTPCDVIILPPGAMKDLIERGLVLPESQTALGLVRLGAAVPAGSIMPDLSSMDSLKQALLSVPSIGLADGAKGATTGIYLNKLFGTLGIADQIAAKVKRYPDGQNAMEAAARNEVAIALGQISEGIRVAGLEPLKALPEEVQLKTVYVAALAKKAQSADAAKQLIKLLVQNPTREAFHSNGFETPEQQANK